MVFLLGGIIAFVILLIEHPSLKVAALLAISVWCFARLYYFAFYVIEHYIDKNYEFSGLWSITLYLYRRRKKERGKLEKSLGGSLSSI